MSQIQSASDVAQYQAVELARSHSLPQNNIGHHGMNFKNASDQQMIRFSATSLAWILERKLKWQRTEKRGNALGFNSVANLFTGTCSKNNY